MCPSQQDGIFDCGEEPEHLSLQHLSILFLSITQQNQGLCGKSTARSCTEPQTDGAGHRAAAGTSRSVTQTFVGYTRIMSSNEEAGLFHSMKASELQASQGDTTRSRQEQEENLILSAWQSMQHSLCEDSGAPGLPQSFLAKQRQSTQARRALSPRPEPR